MSLSVIDADSYINQHVIDIEDWTDADEAKKQRIINVANTTLVRRFPEMTIPDNAVYEFSALLATVFNDTNRLAQQGVASFSLSGVASFTFKNAGAQELSKLITQSVIDLINEANPDLPPVSVRAVKWTVL